MKTVFIADAHLKGLDDPVQARLVAFIDSIQGVERLVILGDLFDYWSGVNQILISRYKPLIESLDRLRKRGASIVYVEGNHDFNLARFFAERLNAAVHADHAELTIDGKRFFLTHGDTVEMTAGYRVWRGFLRSPFFRIIERLIPAKAGWDLAAYLSRRSRARGGYAKNGAIKNGVDEALKKFAASVIARDFDFVVAGHSHAPGVTAIKDGGRTGTYANPGSFINGDYLVHEAGRLRVERAKPGKG